MNQVHKVKKLEDGDFEYRGVEFTRDDSLRGFSGHYRTIRKVAGVSTASGATRRALLANIDALMDRAQ